MRIQPRKEEYGGGALFFFLRIIRSSFAFRPLWPEEKLIKHTALPDRQNPPDTEASRWLKGFDHHLSHVQGLAPRTRQAYCAVVSRFLKGFCGPGAPDWSSLRSEHLTTFVRQEASRLKRNARRAPAVAIRALLRYLKFDGAVGSGMEAAIPRTPRWKLAALPPSLSAVQTERVIAHVATDTPNGQRDRDSPATGPYGAARR